MEFEDKVGDADMHVSFRPSKLDDAFTIGSYMRDIDRKEVGFIWPNLSPVEAVSRSIADTYASHGPCLTCDVNLNPACIFGVRLVEKGFGIIWFLSTDVPEETPILFARYSKKMLKILTKSLLPVHLENTVWAEHKVSRAWLKWLGFSESEPFKDANGIEWVKVSLQLEQEDGEESDNEGEQEDNEDDDAEEGP